MANTTERHQRIAPIHSANIGAKRWGELPDARGNPQSERSSASLRWCGGRAIPRFKFGASSALGSSRSASS